MSLTLKISKYLTIYVSGIFRKIMVKPTSSQSISCRNLYLSKMVCPGQRSEASNNVLLLSLQSENFCDLYKTQKYLALFPPSTISSHSQLTAQPKCRDTQPRQPKPVPFPQSVSQSSTNLAQFHHTRQAGR